MKKIVLIMMAAVIGLGITSCSKSNDRDKFIGVYSIQNTGSYTMSYNGNYVTSPLGGTGEITISPSSAGPNMVIVSGSIFYTQAQVVGNTILMDPENQTVPYDNGTMHITLVHERGIMSGDILTFNTSLSGDYISMGHYFPISGTLNTVAYKQ